MSQNNTLTESEVFDPAETRSGVQFVNIAWQHKWLIVLGGVVGLALGAVYYSQKKPIYMSTAQVLVVKKGPDVLPFPGLDGHMGYSEDYIATQATLIKSPEILGRAAKKEGLLALKTFENVGNPTSAIIAGLSVTRDSSPNAGGSTSILNLSYQGPVADDCAGVLDAVIWSYSDFLDETYQDVSSKTVELIEKAEKLLFTDLKKKQDEYTAFREKAPLLWKAKDGSTSHTDRLTSIEGKRSELVTRRAEMVGRLAAIEKALNEKKSLPDVLELTRDSKVQSEQSQAQLEGQLVGLLIQEQSLLEDFGKDHPQVRAVRRQIEHTRRFFQPGGLANAKAPEGNAAASQARLKEELEQYVQALKRDIKVNKINEESLTKLVEEESKTSGAMVKAEIEDGFKLQDLADTRQLYAGVLKRLEEVHLVKDKDVGGYQAKKISPPGAGWKVGPNPVPIFTTALILGLFGGFGLAYVADMTEQSFRNPEDIRHRLGLPIVGHVPFLGTKEENLAKSSGEVSLLDPMLLTHFRPKSRLAEAYRGIRTSLYFSVRGSGHRVIQVTSPNMGDGKSTLIANLAVSIAQSGKKVLLIDGDLRRPRLHTLFGQENDRGFTSVLQGQSSLADAIHVSDLANLSVLFSGPRCSNPAEMLTSPRLKEIVDSVRPNYDFILIDTPPLLAVTDPCVVAPRVDGVLLVIRIAKKGRPGAERAREILATLNAKVLGVVVNKTQMRKEYGSYGYGSTYGYGYGYGYGDSYGPYDNESYYEDRPAPERNGNGMESQADGSGFASEQLSGAAANDDPHQDRPRSLWQRWFGRW